MEGGTKTAYRAEAESAGGGRGHGKVWTRRGALHFEVGMSCTGCQHTLIWRTDNKCSGGLVWT